MLRYVVMYRSKGNISSLCVALYNIRIQEVLYIFLLTTHKSMLQKKKKIIYFHIKFYFILYIERQSAHTERYIVEHQSDEGASIKWIISTSDLFGRDACMCRVECASERRVVGGGGRQGAFSETRVTLDAFHTLTLQMERDACTTRYIYAACWMLKSVMGHHIQCNVYPKTDTNTWRIERVCVQCERPNWFCALSRRRVYLCFALSDAHYSPPPPQSLLLLGIQRGGRLMGEDDFNG